MSRTLPARAMRRVLLLSALLLMTGAAARAQVVGTKPIYPITFKAGERRTTVEGTVTQPAGEGDMYNSGSERYSLKVSAGQTVAMQISSETGEVVFSLSSPDFQIVEKAGGVRRWSGRLKAAGDYYVTVFARKGSSRFKLRVTLR
jgi:hypothetical protein